MLTVNDVNSLSRVLKDISYPIPEKADRVPWLEKLDVTAESGFPETVSVEADVERENTL